MLGSDVREGCGSSRDEWTLGKVVQANSVASSWTSSGQGHHWILPTLRELSSLNLSCKSPRTDLLRACLLAYSRSFKLEINITIRPTQLKVWPLHTEFQVVKHLLLDLKAWPMPSASHSVLEMSYLLSLWYWLIIWHHLLSISLSSSLSLSWKFLESSLCPSVLKIHNDEIDLLVWICLIQNGRLPPDMGKDIYCVGHFSLGKALAILQPRSLLTRQGLQDIFKHAVRVTKVHTRSLESMPQLNTGFQELCWYLP